MLRRPLFAGLSLAVAALGAGLGAASCGSTVVEDGGSGGTTTTSTTGTGGSGGDTGGSGGLGGGGAAPACYDTPDAVFAIDELFFGDTDWSGAASPSAWKMFGRNVDGLTTAGDLTGHCQLFGGAPAATADDGNAGIDNSWGRNVLPIMLGLAPDYSATVNDAIAHGDFTWIARLQGLGAASSQTPVPGLFYEAAPLGHPAQFSELDCWPVYDGSLVDPLDIDAAKLSLPDGALAANSWSSDTAVTLTLNVPSGGMNLSLKIHEAKISFALDANHQGATQGIISGVLDLDETLAMMQAVAGGFDPSLCSGATWDSIAAQFRQTADVMADGTQDPSATCNGISIGVGFTLWRASLGGIEEQPPPPPNPCVN